MLQLLRLHGLGQLAQLNSKKLCAHSGLGHGLPEFQRPPVEHKKAIITLGDRLHLNQSRLHWWGDAVTAHERDCCFPGPIGCLRPPGDEYLCPGY